jgi:peroxiredoxin Q/BCP
MEKGDSVSEFSALDQFGTKVSLSELLAHGRVVLYFYPKAMTGG